MSDRILNSSRLRVLGGRPALLCLFILTAAMILTPIIAIGGGGNESPRLTIQLPRGLAVKSSLHGKRQLQGNLPAGGRYVWSVVGGKGVVRLKTPALDSSIPEGTVKIEGVKPGRVDLRLEYRRLKSGQAGRNGEEEVLAFATASTVVFDVAIEPPLVSATEGQAEPIKLVVLPPLDTSFQLQDTVLSLYNSAGTELSSWHYAASLFSQDLSNPERLIYNANFTPEVGLSSQQGLTLGFVATASVVDPGTGLPTTINAGYVAQLNVIPAVTPPLSVTFTTPSDPFEMQAGSSAQIGITINTSNTSQTSAAFFLYKDGIQVSTESINLSGFTVTTNSMTGTYSFTAPQEPGNFEACVTVYRDVETATHMAPLMVTPAPMPQPVIDITTSSPIYTTEGGQVQVDFTFSPSSIYSMISQLEWRVLDGSTVIFGSPIDPSLLNDDNQGHMVGNVVFTVPTGLVDTARDFTFEVFAQVSAAYQASDTITLNIAPIPEEPISITVYSQPPDPIFETEEVEYRFLLSPGSLFPNLLGGTYALLDRSTGEQLFISNIDLATLVVNSHITGAVSFVVPEGLAAINDGNLWFQLTFWTDRQVASEKVPLDIFLKPSVTLSNPNSLFLTENQNNSINVFISPGTSIISSLNWSVLSQNNTSPICLGEIDPSEIHLQNGVLVASLNIIPPIGSSQFENVKLNITVNINGFQYTLSSEYSVTITSNIEVAILNDSPLSVVEGDQIQLNFNILGVNNISFITNVTSRIIAEDNVILEKSFIPTDILSLNSGSLSGVITLTTPSWISNYLKVNTEIVVEMASVSLHDSIPLVVGHKYDWITILSPKYITCDFPNRICAEIRHSIDGVSIPEGEFHVEWELMESAVSATIQQDINIDGSSLGKSKDTSFFVASLKGANSGNIVFRAILKVFPLDGNSPTIIIPSKRTNIWAIDAKIQTDEIVVNPGGEVFLYAKIGPFLPEDTANAMIDVSKFYISCENGYICTPRNISLNTYKISGDKDYLVSAVNFHFLDVIDDGQKLKMQFRSKLYIKDNGSYAQTVHVLSDDVPLIVNSRIIENRSIEIISSGETTIINNNNKYVYNISINEIEDVSRAILHVKYIDIFGNPGEPIEYSLENFIQNNGTLSGQCEIQGSWFPFPGKFKIVFGIFDGCDKNGIDIVDVIVKPENPNDIIISSCALSPTVPNAGEQSLVTFNLSGLIDNIESIDWVILDNTNTKKNYFII